jgi:hypothetical protein
LGLSSAGNPTYFSDSFWPTIGADASGAAAPEIWWRQRINGGAPFPSADGTFSITDSDPEVRSSEGGTRQTRSVGSTATKSSSTGTIRLSLRGAQVTQLVLGTPATIIDHTDDEMQDESTPTGTTHTDQSVVDTMSPPERVFADRTDLDQLPVGYIEEASFTRTRTITVRAIGDFNYVEFFKRHRETSFAHLDTRVYSPLALALKLGRR